MSTEREPVTFLNSAGETISNDPLWLAQQTLSANGVEGRKPDFDIAGPYDHLDGPELKALAKERGIKTTGWRKASLFREALEEWDEVQADADADADSDSDDDDSDDSDKSSDSDDE